MVRARAVEATASVRVRILGPLVLEDIAAQDTQIAGNEGVSMTSQQREAKERCETVQPMYLTFYCHSLLSLLLYRSYGTWPPYETSRWRKMQKQRCPRRQQTPTDVLHMIGKAQPDQRSRCR